MATRKAPEAPEIQIVRIEKGHLEFCLLGTRPLILNRMAQKAWFELLAPKGRKTAADKAANVKHDPIKEFRDAPYLIESDASPAAIGILGTSFKKALGTAALRMPGTKKTEIGQLVTIEDEIVPVFGLPKVFMAVTRSADVKKTPDIRTRAIVGEWACRVRLSFIRPLLNEQDITNLLVAAGVVSGVGDWRQEKGSGSYGAFTVVDPEHPDFVRITSEHDRDPQLQALEEAEPFNAETSEMLQWFGVEMRRRGFKVHEGARA